MIRENCGIIALDALLKSLELNMNRISLDTLSKICRDNGRLMFPLKVPKEKLLSIGFPFILQTNNHYEVMEDENALDVSDIKEFAYVLHPSLNPQIIPFVIDEDESKKVTGACSGGVKNIPIVGPYISKPGRLLPMALAAGGQMLGVPAPLTMAAATAAGIGQGATTGLWGEKGAGSSLLSGGLQGFGQGMVGRGVGGGLSTVFKTAQAPAGATGFLSGFKEGFGQSIPFGQTLGLYKPMSGITSVGSLGGISKPGVYNVGGMTSPVVATGESFMPPGGGGAAAKAAQTGAGGFLSNIFGGGGGGEAGGGSNILPYLMMGAGSLIPQPEYNVPSGADVLAKYQGMGATTAEGAAARQKILDYIQNPQNVGGQATTDYLKSTSDYLNLQEKEAMSSFDAAWNAAHPGGAYGSDYYQARAKAQNDIAIKKNAAMDAIRSQAWQQQVNAQLQMISAAYGVDQQMLQDLMNLDITNAAAKYGISVEKVNQLRQTIYNMALMNFQGNLQQQSNAQMEKIMDKYLGSTTAA